MKKRSLFTALCLLSMSSAQSTEFRDMDTVIKEAQVEWNEAKFGMFIHFGLYSQIAGNWKGQVTRAPYAEWAMQIWQISREEYASVAATFNPVEFDAKEYVALAKEAGMRYIVAMPKHHDGFAMYDSKVSDYNIVKRTPFKRDPIWELYEACKEAGLRFGIYYSHVIDWYDGGTANMKGTMHPIVGYVHNGWDPVDVSFEDYINNKSLPQVEELLQTYPDLIEIWYDFPSKTTREQAQPFYDLVKKYQPSCLVNSRCGPGLGDFYIPGDNKIPKSIVEGRYWETPGTMNRTWGYKFDDHDWKTREELIFWIVEIASKGGNYLLNIGPKGDGSVPQESIDGLKAIGEWMAVNGEAIYGSSYWLVNREGSFTTEMKDTAGMEGKKKKVDFLFSENDCWYTAKGKAVYAIHFVRPADGLCVLESFAIGNDLTSDLQIETVEMLGHEGLLEFSRTKKGLEIRLPEAGTGYGYALKIQVR